MLPTCGLARRHGSSSHFWFPTSAVLWGHLRRQGLCSHLQQYGGVMEGNEASRKGVRMGEVDRRNKAMPCARLGVLVSPIFSPPHSITVFSSQP